MESLAFTHLALAYEDPSSLNLSTCEVFDLLNKLSLLALLKQEKVICKAWLYGLSLSLTFIPFNDTLALHFAKRQERIKTITASNSESKIGLAKLPNSSFLAENEKTQISSVLPSKKQEQEKTILAKVSEGKISQVDSANITPHSQAPYTTTLVQYTENKVPVSNPDSKAESKPPSSNQLPISKSNPSPKNRVEQRGKLRFINDTFYTAIVFLYQPNNQQRPYRFIHIPPCKGREFLATYSNFWKVSFNEHKVYSVDQVSIKKGNFFEIKTSNLTGEQKWNNSCKNPVLITPVNRERFKDSTALIKDYENEEIDNLNYNGVLDLAKYANFMEKAINSLNHYLMSLSYCELEQTLKEITFKYPEYNKRFKKVTGFDLNKQASQEEKDEYKKILGENINIDEIIIIFELYLLTKNYFYEDLNDYSVQSLDKIPLYHLTNISDFSKTKSNSTGTHEEYACRFRLENGLQPVSLQASASSKKVKHC